MDVYIYLLTSETYFEGVDFASAHGSLEDAMNACGASEWSDGWLNYQDNMQWDARWDNKTATIERVIVNAESVED